MEETSWTWCNWRIPLLRLDGRWPADRPTCCPTDCPTYAPCLWVTSSLHDKLIGTMEPYPIDLVHFFNCWRWRMVWFWLRCVRISEQVSPRPGYEQLWCGAVLLLLLPILPVVVPRISIYRYHTSPNHPTSGSTQPTSHTSNQLHSHSIKAAIVCQRSLVRLRK